MAPILEGPAAVPQPPFRRPPADAVTANVTGRPDRGRSVRRGVPGRRSERDGDRGALAGGTVDGDRAVVTVHNGLDDAQPEADALDFRAFGGAGPPERGEQPVPLLGRETDTGVAHLQRRPPVA